MANKFKTGTVANVRMTLTITGEVISSLSQIVVVYYYIRNTKKIKFSYHAIDPNEAEIAAEAISENKTVHQIVLDGEVLVMIIPIEDTDTLEIETCEELPIFAEITYVDSNNEKRKAIPDPDCDVPVGTLVKSITEGWL